MSLTQEVKQKLICQVMNAKGSTRSQKDQKLFNKFLNDQITEEEFRDSYKTALKKANRIEELQEKIKEKMQGLNHIE